MHRGYTTPLVIAIMAFAIVAFLFLIDTAIMPATSNQTANRTANKNANTSIVTSPTVDIPTDTWKTFTDTSTGVSIQYPQDWQEKSCGDAMLIYFAPEEISCGAGLNAIGLQRATSDQTVAEAIALRQAQLEQTTVLRLAVAGQDAQRLIGFDPQSALGVSETQQNDEIYFRQEGYLWNFSSTLEDDGRIFLKMAETLTLTKPTASDPTAGWKTYTNSTLGYTIKYPNDWGIGLETDKQTTISGAGGGSPFTAPGVSITASEPDQPSSCLLKEETVTVLGENRLRQTQGCGYAGSNIVTFIKKGSTYISVSWTEDVAAAYPTYDLMLSTFDLID